MPSYRPQAKTRPGSAAHSAAMAWVNRRPAGVGTTSRVPGGRTSSRARPQGSGRMTMPGPPPYGASSTVRWRSSVQARRSCTAMVTRPRSAALPSSDWRSGARYSGKIVTTSTRKPISELQEALGRVHDDLPGGEVDGGDDGAHERDQHLTAVAPADDEQLGALVADGGDLTEHRPVGKADGQPDQLVVVEDVGVLELGQRRDLDEQQGVAHL